MIATTKDLKTLADQGLIVQQLYYRINGIHIPIPPLRANPEDVPQFMNAFLAELNAIHKTEKNLSREAMDILLRYPWPGNIRQLKNAVTHAFQMASKKIGVKHLPEEISQFDPDADFTKQQDNLSMEALNLKLKVLEKTHIQQSILHCRGNIRKTAKLLGIHHQTLYNKMKSLGISTE